MATTSYFEEELFAVAKNGKADRNAPKILFEIYISSFSGEHQLYLKHKTNDSEEVYSIIEKDQALRMLEGLENAVHYLGYLK